MKKITLMAVAALALGFSACDNLDLPDPTIQNNPQEPLFETDELAITGVDAATVLNLADYEAEDAQLPVAEYTLKDFPEGYNLVLTMDVAAENTFDNVKNITATPLEGMIYVNPDEFEAAYKATVGKAPVEGKCYIRFHAYAGLDEIPNIAIGGADKTFGPYTLTVLPTGYIIEEAYYLLTKQGDWTNNPVKLTHGNQDVYDDPKFTTLVYVSEQESAAGFEWVLVPESAIENLSAGDFQMFYSEEANSGALLEGVGLNNHGTISGIDGPVLISFNMMNRTWEAIVAYEYIYTPGPANGWKPSESQALFTEDYINYHGYVHIQDMVKFTIDDSWSVEWGYAGEEGKVTTSGGGNIEVATEGLYYVELNTMELTYKLTLINSIGVLGDATNVGWDKDNYLELTPSADFLTWTGDIEFLATGGWKFTTNHDWGINLGGDSLEDLVANGANLPTPGAGTYTVTLKLGELPYMTTVVAK